MKLFSIRYFQHHIVINRALPALTAFRKETSCKIYNIHSAIVELFLQNIMWSCKSICFYVGKRFGETETETF